MKKSINYGEYRITREENGSIRVLKNGIPQENTKAALREIAQSINLDIQSNWNTQQFGSKLSKAIEDLQTDGSMRLNAVEQEVSNVSIGSVEGEGVEESMQLCQQIVEEMQKLGLDRFIIDGEDNFYGCYIDGNVHIVNEEEWGDYCGDFEYDSRLFTVNNGDFERIASVKGFSLKDGQLIFHVLFATSDDNGVYVEDEELAEFSLKDIYDKYQYMDEFNLVTMLETYLHLLQGTYDFGNEPVKWEVKEKNMAEVKISMDELEYIARGAYKSYDLACGEIEEYVEGELCSLTSNLEMEDDDIEELQEYIRDYVLPWRDYDNKEKAKEWLKEKGYIDATED